VTLPNTLEGREFMVYQEDDAAFALPTASSGKPGLVVGGGIYRSSLPTYTNGDAVCFHFDANGRLMVDTELTLDSNVIIDNVAVWATDIADSSTSGFALIDGDGHPQVDVLTMPGGLTAYAEDAQHTDGDKGIMALGVRNDALASLNNADGDYAPFQVNAKGGLYVDISSVLGADMATGNRLYSHANVDQLGGESVGDHGSAVIDHGIQPLLEAKDFDGSALPNSATEGQAVRAAGTLAGMQFAFLTNELGTATPLVADDAEISAANGGTVGFMGMANARSVQKAAVAEGDAVRAVSNLHGEQAIAGYTWATQSNRVEEVNDLGERHVEETLADSSGITAGTYYYFDMDGFRYFSLQCDMTVVGSITLTVEATVEDDGTVDTACFYTDTTNSWFGAENFTAACFLEKDTPTLCKYVRVKIVATDASDEWVIYLKRMW